MSVPDKRQQHDPSAPAFTKAFDRVSHERLLGKLDRCSVRGSTLEWIRVFFTDIVQQVTVEGATSDSIQVLSRVHQGTVLGLLLFLVFIIDLPNGIESKSDSLLLSAYYTDASKTLKIEKLFKKICQHGKINGECHFVLRSVAPSESPKKPILSSQPLKGHTLNMEYFTRYLGVELQSNMSIKKHLSRKRTALLNFFAAT